MFSVFNQIFTLDSCKHFKRTFEKLDRSADATQLLNHLGSNKEKLTGVGVEPTTFALSGQGQFNMEVAWFSLSLQGLTITQVINSFSSLMALNVLIKNPDILT